MPAAQLGTPMPKFLWRPRWRRCQCLPMVDRFLILVRTRAREYMKQQQQQQRTRETKREKPQQNLHCGLARRVSTPQKRRDSNC